MSVRAAISGLGRIDRPTPKPRPSDSQFCHHCGSPMELIGTDWVQRGYETHTLKCPGCGRLEDVLVAPPARGTT
jgi:hypothetical protein